MKKGMKVNVFSWVAAVAVLAAAVPINMIFSKVDVSFDVTPFNAYTLSDDAVKSLEAMTKPVDMYIMCKLDNLYLDVIPGEKEYMMADMFVHTIEQMSEYDNITLHEVDLVSDPTFVEEKDPDGKMNLSLGDILLECGDKKRDIDFATMFAVNSDTENVEFYGENYIMGAIDYLESEIVPTVYFVTGHDEKKIDEYKSLTNTLRSQNYDAKTIDFSETKSIPDDATTLVLAAPKSDISNDEKEIISSYLDKGGNICLLMAPNDDKIAYKNIEELMEQYRLYMDYNKVYETANGFYSAKDKYTVKCEFFDTEFTEGLREMQGEEELFMSPSRSFYSSESEEDDGMTVEPLIQTFNTAMSEVYGGTLTDVQPPLGILYLAARAENPSRNNSKMFVAGAAEFMDDTPKSEDGLVLTTFLFLTTISWMDQVNGDMIYPTHIQTTDYITIPNEKTGNIILVIMIAFPIIISLTGVIIWARRRNA